MKNMKKLILEFLVVAAIAWALAYFIHLFAPALPISAYIGFRVAFSQQKDLKKARSKKIAKGKPAIYVPASAVDFKNRVADKEKYFASSDLKNFDFTYMDLKECNFSEADLEGADFSHAILKGSLFINSKLRGAQFSSADVRQCDFQGSPLNDCTCEHTDFREASNILFDSTYVKNSRVTPNSNHIWPLLRRKFSGSHFTIHLLLAIVFFVPLFLRMEALVTWSEMQHYVVDANRFMYAWAEGTKRQIAHELYELKLPGEEQIAIHETASKKLDSVVNRFELKPCLAEKCRKEVVWKLLMTEPKENQFGFIPLLFEGLAVPVLLLVYNSLRAILIVRVSSMKDEEDRSGYTPALRQYSYLFFIYWIYSTIMLVAIPMLLREITNALFYTWVQVPA